MALHQHGFYIPPRWQSFSIVFLPSFLCLTSFASCFFVRLEHLVLVKQAGLARRPSFFRREARGLCQYLVSVTRALSFPA